MDIAPRVPFTFDPSGHGRLEQLLRCLLPKACASTMAPVSERMPKPSHIADQTLMHAGGARRDHTPRVAQVLAGYGSTPDESLGMMS